MMTDEQRYLFDLQGYLVIPGVLDAAQVKRMHDDMTTHGIADPENNPGASRFGNFLTWGKHWSDLIDQPTILPILLEMLGPKLRLDHVYGMAMSAKGAKGGEGLHHHAGMFHHGCFYATHADKMHNGLLVVSYAMADVPKGAGGFCCIPGSHKSIYPTPGNVYSVDHPLVVQPPLRAGDVLIFTEALTHGTMAWTESRWERRAVLLKYCPLYAAWAQHPINADIIPGLTERQKLILAHPYVGNRPALPA
jgi:hypothetical protein